MDATLIRPVSKRRRETSSAGLCALIAIFTLGAAAVAAAEPVGDPVMGSRLFLQCRACHTAGASEASGVGPNLYGVVGAKSAAKPGYKYSAGLSASGLIWTPVNLDAWIKKPTALVPDTKMAFAGVSDAQMRKNLIAYLSTLQSGSKTKGQSK